LLEGTPHYSKKGRIIYRIEVCFNRATTGTPTTQTQKKKKTIGSRKDCREKSAELGFVVTTGRRESSSCISNDAAPYLCNLKR
jgi:hypothetical protein